MAKKITQANEVRIVPNHRDLEEKTEALKPVPKTVKEQIPEYLLQFFEYGHLPVHVQGTSMIFHEAAYKIVATCPRNPERTMALRRLLEAKDCAVRAQIFKAY